MNIHGKAEYSWFRDYALWWDYQGIAYELLQPNEIITRDQYRFHMMRLSRALKEKRPQYEQRHNKLILQHDNDKPHVAQVKTYLETLKWEVLSYPLYSLGIAMFDYHLFRSMTWPIRTEVLFI